MRFNQWIAMPVLMLTFTYSVNAQHDNDTTKSKIEKKYQAKAPPTQTFGKEAFEKSRYIANRGSNKIHGAQGGPGSVSVMDFATEKIVATWPIPGGGSPDMGNDTADGKQLWLSGRYDHVVYVFDTATGAVQKIKVGIEPHGLTVWPQPGRYSLGHTGNMR